MVAKGWSQPFQVKGWSCSGNLHSFTDDAINEVPSNLPERHNQLVLLLQNTDTVLQQYLDSFFDQRVPISAQKNTDMISQGSIKHGGSCNKPNALELVCKHSEVSTVQAQKSIGNNQCDIVSAYWLWSLALLRLEHPVLWGNRTLRRKQTEHNVNLKKKKKNFHFVLWVLNSCPLFQSELSPVSTFLFPFLRLYHVFFLFVCFSFFFF